MKKMIPCHMTRLSFGLLCAQSSAMFCLEKTLNNNATGASYETIRNALAGFYVDDGLFSFMSENELIKFYDGIIPLLKSKGFPRTKFFSNSEKLK